MIDIVKPDKIDKMFKITNRRLFAFWILLFCVGVYAVYTGEFYVLAVATVLIFWGLCTILIIRKRNRLNKEQ